MHRSWRPRGGDVMADRQVGIHPTRGHRRRGTVGDRIERGLVWISTITRLEIGFSFRSAEDAREESASPPIFLMPLEYLTPRPRIVRLRSNFFSLTAASTARHPSPTCW